MITAHLCSVALLCFAALLRLLEAQLPHCSGWYLMADRFTGQSTSLLDQLVAICFHAPLELASWEAFLKKGLELWAPLYLLLSWHFEQLIRYD